MNRNIRTRILLAIVFYLLSTQEFGPERWRSYFGGYYLSDQDLAIVLGEEQEDSTVVLFNSVTKGEKSKLNGAGKNKSENNKEIPWVNEDENAHISVNVLEEDDIFQKHKNREEQPLLGSELSGLIEFKILNKNENFATKKQYTLLLEIINNGNDIQNANLGVQLPEVWQLISVNKIGALKKGEKKIATISFYIPSNASSGEVTATFELSDIKDYVLASHCANLKVAMNYDLELFNVHFPPYVEAGETINASYAVKNIGNTVQEIRLDSRNSIQGNDHFSIAPDSIIMVQLEQKTDAKSYGFTSISTNLEITSEESGEKYRAFNSVKVYPVTIAKKDPYLRFPMKASVYYNSYTGKEDHYSSMSFEVSGNGYLDKAKEHHIDFLLRGPDQDRRRYFGIRDHYSLKYKYKTTTNLTLGDHSFYLNRLGIMGKYGQGFKIDQQVKNWILTAFYTKPRQNDYDPEAFYGLKTAYKVNKTLSSSLSYSKTKRLDPFFSGAVNEDRFEEGELVTLGMDYKGKKTSVTSETSVSSTNKDTDYANYINLSQRFGKLHYSGSFTVVGENYFGTMNNSLQYSNSLNYNLKEWDFRLGQGMSRVNKRLDPLYYAAEPYYENLYATVRYRINKKNSLNFRIDQRMREDRLEPKNYHYKENGFDYGYSYNSTFYTVGFNGRMAKSQDLLAEDLEYNLGYSHSLNLSYYLAKNFSFFGNINHMYSKRYKYNKYSSVNYSLGINHKINNKLQWNANFNSGFSPEESYLRRDYISLNVLSQLTKNHHFEIRTNYYENPGVTNQKELFAYGKYTYNFGVPLKKVIADGVVKGRVTAGDNSIDIKGIKINVAGKTVMTSKDGVFEINNIPIGKNYVLIDQSSLPAKAIVASNVPYEVVVDKTRTPFLHIELVKAASLHGKINLKSTDPAHQDKSLRGYLKLETEGAVLYTESNDEGEFTFDNIIPGKYVVTILRLKNNENLFQYGKTAQIIVEDGGEYFVNIDLELKQRNIKFKNKNFNIDWNE
ncbi:hypothetical protein HCG49_10560 [Arenibacter sp. 6A1]|uniref:hypothetical protein n=1 Tax=Arenibacter sp. 6A1 TaxID=2720391 RepID=UPI0014484B01|nr:hypothetical protein [Arenibacter sp. 6A1]NKI27003.1 hypothetical protein [Arenibacter sp. 6A1]